ncbi:septation ring formation regulator EzrA [Actinotalea ferrariae CF5-4]|uniref:Septation ring formation regulator EzrA n=1 Tax=Actinotalea ferrariae CF5-4 TaxID=948458 RepID=A0A021VQB7_9CELL|nr:septation ring formation regulator EzrA [Actinotalea ferrariae CF5-4]
MRLARLLSVRAMVLGVVGLVAFTLLFPSVRAYLGQQAELDAMEQDLVAAQQRQADLVAELDRWEDPAYVEAQARSRLSYVMPGETPYRVIDPEVVVEAPAMEGTTAPQTGPALPVGGSGTPWYTTIWDSVEVAGEVPVPEGDE